MHFSIAEYAPITLQKQATSKEKEVAGKQVQVNGCFGKKFSIERI